MATTPAQRLLKQRKIDHEILTYDHRVKGAEFAAEALDWPLEAMFKTLVVVLDSRKMVLACMPGNAGLSLKQLARVAGAKQARMSTPEEAEKATGYKVGGISPFGTRKQMDVFLDESANDHDRIAVNGGAKGTIVTLAPADLIAALDTTVATLQA